MLNIWFYLNGQAAVATVVTGDVRWSIGAVGLMVLKAIQEAVFD